MNRPRKDIAASPLAGKRLMIAYSFSSQMPGDRDFNQEVENILRSMDAKKQ